MKLPLIPHDKANHFIYGFAIYVIWALFLPSWSALLITICAAISKEAYDFIDYGKFDIFDLLVTILPAFILFII